MNNQQQMPESVRLALIARNVESDTPPLEGAYAYLDVDHGDGGRVRFDVFWTEAAGGLFDGLDVESPETDRRLPHSFLPRYELVDARGLPAFECAFATITITPLEDDGDGGEVSCVFETTVATWLGEAEARGATVALWRIIGACTGAGGDE